jgi:hypothetical protein
MRRTLSGFAVVCLLACLAPAAAAQQRRAGGQTPAPAEANTTSAGERQAAQAARPDDLSITAHVTAESLVFRKVPTPRVEFTGRPRRQTSWEAERTNLPERVQPGVTYRDIGITLRITSVFPDIERIVAEALGEVPAGAGPAPEDQRPDEPTTPGASSSLTATPGPTDRPRVGPASEARAQIQARRAATAPARAGARARRPSARREGRGQ